MKILVSGADSQLAKSIKLCAAQLANAEWHFLRSSELDIRDQDQFQNRFQEFSPDFFINCAAYTAVDKAEDESELAFEVNSNALRNISKHCEKNNCFLIHFSSDYVYHHNPGRPLFEIDACKPVGVYARSKRQGELNIVNNTDKFCVIRTSWVYSPFGNNFVRTMRKLSTNRDELRIVSDQIGSPTYAIDLANILIEMISLIYKSEYRSQYSGFYNYSNSGLTNWAEFAEKIFKISKAKTKVIPIKSSEFNARAERPSWSLMDKDKICSVFGIKLSHWEESLRKCLEILSKEN